MPEENAVSAVQAEQPKKVRLARTGNFPYVMPSGYGEFVADVDPARFEELKKATQEQNTLYVSYKNGRGIPGMEAFAAEQAKIDELRAAMDAATRAFEEAHDAFAEKCNEHMQEVAAEKGVSRHQLLEESKREGQRIVCAAMVTAFPDIFAEHPKYKNVAAGQPVKEEEAEATVMAEDPQDPDAEEKGDDHPAGAVD